MSGNGGSAGYQDLADYQKDFHGLTMLGLTSLGRNWQGVLANSAGISVAVLHTAGLGYNLGELVRVTGGGDGNALVEITKVTAGTGAVEAFTIFSAGTNYDTAIDVTTTAFESGSTADDNFTINIYAVSDRPYAIEATYKDNPSVARFILERGLTDVGGNPFSGRTAFNPDPLLEEIATQLEALKQQVELIDVPADFGTDMVTAMSETASASVVATASAEAISQAMTYAASLVSAALNNAQARVSALAPSLHSTADARETAWSAAALTAAIANAKTAYADVFNNLETTSPSTTVTSDATAAFATCLPSIDTLMSISLNIAKQAAQDIIMQAMQNALSLIDDGFVTSAVANYERRALKTFLRNVNRFTAPMADMGATDGSSFIVGLALLHSDYQADVNDFQAKLELQLFQTLFDNFVSFSSATMQSYLQVYGVQYAMKCGLYEQLYSALSQQSNTSINAYMQMIAAVFGTKLDAYKTMSIEGGMIDSTMKLESTVADAGTARYIDQAMRERLTLLTNGIDQLFNRRQLALQAQNNLVSTVAEANRIRIVAKEEEKSRQDEYDVKEATWDLELFQLGGNILSAVSGAVVPTAAKPAPWQSALGGALAISGAALSLASGNPFALLGANKAVDAVTHA